MLRVCYVSSEHRCSTRRNILIATDCALLNAGFLLNYQPIDIITAGTNMEKESGENILACNKTHATILFQKKKDKA